jgi:hypothetical protein
MESGRQVISLRPGEGHQAEVPECPAVLHLSPYVFQELPGLAGTGSASPPDHFGRHSGHLLPYTVREGERILDPVLFEGLSRKGRDVQAVTGWYEDTRNTIPGIF